jgi:hypothetical protein
MSYNGNKRNEVPHIFPLLDLTNITTIVEPFCGTCAFSFYVSLQKPNLTYVLNDNNIYLKQMYDIIKNDQLLSNFENEVNTLIDTIKNKEDYKTIVKKDDIISWFIKNKYYCIHPGLYPADKEFKHVIMQNHPIVNFFKNNNIIYTCDNAINIYKNYKNKQDALIFLDPPYINTSNSFYIDPELNIYEYLYNNNIQIEEASIYLILENIWIIQLLFKENNQLFIYNKKYEKSKKKTTHIIISN